MENNFKKDLIVKKQPLLELVLAFLRNYQKNFSKITKIYIKSGFITNRLRVRLDLYEKGES